LKKWAGYVASIRERRGIYRVLVGKIEGTRPFRDPGVDGRMMFRWNFRKCVNSQSPASQIIQNIQEFSSFNTQLYKQNEATMS